MPVLVPIITAAGLIGSAAINYFSQKNANSKNIAFQQKTNDENYRRYLEQRDYSSPKNMMQQYADAGVNPAVAYGNLSGATRLAPPEIDSPKVNPAELGGIDAITSLANIILNMKQGEKIESETNTIDIENKTRAQQIALELEKLTKENKNLDQAFTVNAKSILLKEEELNLRKQSVQAEISLQLNTMSLQNLEMFSKEQQIEFQKTRNSIEKVSAQYAEAKTQAELANLNSQTKENIANLQLIAKKTNNEQLRNSLMGIEQSLALESYQANAAFTKAKAFNEQMKIGHLGGKILKTGGKLLKTTGFDKKIEGFFNKTGTKSSRQTWQNQGKDILGTF